MPKKIRFSLRKTRRAARSSCLLIRIRTFPVTNRMKQHTFGAPESINCLFSFFENRVRSAFEIGGTRRTVAMRGSRGPGRRWLAPSILRCGWAAAASGSCSTSSRGRGAARSRQRLGSSRRRCADPTVFSLFLALRRHRRRHVRRAGMGVPVLEMTASPRRSF